MKFYQTLFLYLTLGIACSTMSAQTYLFDLEVIGVENGLPEREVYDLVVDKKGYLWISTQGAISRYDGNHFKTYTYRQLNINEYRPASLAVDEHNNIWYVEHQLLEGNNHSGVINTSNDSIYTLESYTNGVFKSKNIHSLNCAFENPNLWYLTSHEGSIYEYKNGSFKEIYTLEIVDAIKTAIHCEPNGKGAHWIIHNNKIINLQHKQPRDSFMFKEEHISLVKVDQAQNSLIVASFNDKKNATFWEFRDNQFIPYQVPSKLSDNVIRLEKDFNTYLIKDTIFILDDNHQILFKQQNPVGGNMPNMINYLKEQQIILLSTPNGIIKIKRRKKPFKVSHKGYSIRGLYAEKDYLWVGGERLNKKVHLPTGAAEPLIIQYVNDPYLAFTRNFKDSNNNWWLGTNANILVKGLSNNTQQSIYKRVGQVGELSIPFENPQTGKLWIGTSTGLIFFDKTTQQFIPFELTKRDAIINIKHLYQNEKGIWILTNEGIFLMDAQSETILKHYTEADGFPNINFMHLHEDVNGIFWLATKGGGLIKWDIAQNTIQEYTKAQGLSHNVLYAVYEDDYENLWLPSDYGLMQFDKNTLTTKVYLPQNGISHEEFNTFSHAQAADGTLYFGGLNGMIEFHPKVFHDKNNNYSPPLLLTSVKLLEAETSQFKDITSTYIKHKAIELAPDYQMVELEVSLLDYESTKNNQYAYQIEGYQNNWTYTKDNTISIFKLPYGDYQVNLKARGPSGLWTDKIVTFPLIVSTPFYLRGWFLFSLLSLAILGVVIFIKRREVNLQKDRIRLEQEIKKRTATIVKQTKELEALDKAKTRFFSNITHEFRTPLTLIIGPLRQIIKESKDMTLVNRLTDVTKNAQQILRLINQLLDISKSESGNLKVEISQGDLTAHTRELVDEFQRLAKQKNQRLVFSAQQTEWITNFDRDKWSKIIYNLTFNAIKFTLENGLIELSLTKKTNQDTEWIHLKIKDSGVGIEASQLSQIFNRFYQADNSMTRLQEGTGVGLALVKELVELQEGEISVTSKVNVGTTFEVLLPIPKITSLEMVENKSIKPELISPVIQQVEQSTVGVVDTSTNKEQALKILLIEDNQEMLQYTVSCLDSKKYDIHTAVNGVKGIAKALTLVPDLIVSDVMMPLKDGFEVTKTIRQNLATSHIPIILLTAKAALESRLEGLERGADAYLTKPFSSEELVMRVQKLIEIRQLLQKRYQNQNFVEEQEIESYQNEDIFIRQLKRIINNNLDNSKLGGEMIAKKIGVSRMQLHRKLKALTNQSTSVYIQNIRLKEAFRLIKEKELNISEIAYKTGFSTPNHFSRLFKQKYGIPPSKVGK